MEVMRVKKQAKQEDLEKERKSYRKKLMRLDNALTALRDRHRKEEMKVVEKSVLRKFIFQPRLPRSIGVLDLDPVLAGA